MMTSSSVSEWRAPLPSAVTPRSMTIRFTARTVGVAEEPESKSLTVGIGEDGSGMVLLFMCGLLEPNEQDIALGHDTHCLVTEDQGTAYGVVEQVTLRGRVLLIKISDGGLEALGLDDPEIEAVIEADDVTIDQLRDGLRRVMAYGRPDAHPAVIEL